MLRQLLLSPLTRCDDGVYRNSSDSSTQKRPHSVFSFQKLMLIVVPLPKRQLYATISRYDDQKIRLMVQYMNLVRWNFKMVHEPTLARNQLGGSLAEMGFQVGGILFTGGSGRIIYKWRFVPSDTSPRADQITNVRVLLSSSCPRAAKRNGRLPPPPSPFKSHCQFPTPRQVSPFL